MSYLRSPHGLGRLLRRYNAASARELVLTLPRRRRRWLDEIRRRAWHVVRFTFGLQPFDPYKRESRKYMRRGLVRESRR